MAGSWSSFGLVEGLFREGGTLLDRNAVRARTRPGHLVSSVLEALQPFVQRRGSVNKGKLAHQWVRHPVSHKWCLTPCRTRPSWWVALSEAESISEHGQREAPPWHVACRMFFTPAGWFQALLQGEVFPFKRIVIAQRDVQQLGIGPHEIRLDESPWRGGAVCALRYAGKLAS